MNKAQLRRVMTEKRNGLGLVQVKQYSRIITERLLNSSEYRGADIIFCYLSHNNEVITDWFIKQAIREGKTVAVPYCDYSSDIMHAVSIKSVDSGLARGKMGIREPEDISGIIPPQEINLVITPGLAFDLAGNRLGYGKGFYDGYLSRVSRDTEIAGVCFEFQLVKSIPAEEHDKRVPCIFTERKEIHLR